MDVKANKVGTFSIIMIVVAYACTINNVTAGASLGFGTTMVTGLLAMAVGFVILSILSTASGLIGAREGAKASTLYLNVFGTQGSRVVAMIPAICCTIWQVFDFWYVGAIMSDLFSNHPHIGFVIGIVIICSCAIFGSYFGVTSLKWLSNSTIPIALVLFVVLLIATVDRSGGVSALANYVPSQAIPFVTAVNMFVGSFIAVTSMWSDITSDAKSPKSVFAAMPLGMLMVWFLFIVGQVAAVGLNCFGITELAATLGGVLQILTSLFCIFALGNTVPSTTYMISNQFSAALKCSPKVFIIVIPLLEAGLTFVIQYVTSISVISTWVNALSCVLAPVVGVCLCDYWLVNRGKFSVEYTNTAVRPAAAVSVLIGFAFGVYFTYFSTVLPAAIGSCLTAVIAHLILRKAVHLK